MTDLQTALSKMQRTLVATKGQYNSFGKYKYRSCEDILAAVKKVLPSDVILLLEDEVINISDRIYIKATASLFMAGDVIKVSANAREPLSKKGMDEAQITGAASSYARKYALNGLFAIDDTKDSDATNNHKDEPVSKPAVKPAPQKAITTAQAKKIKDLLESKQINIIGFLKWAQAKDVESIAESNYEIVLKELEKRPMPAGASCATTT